MVIISIAPSGSLFCKHSKIAKAVCWGSVSFSEGDTRVRPFTLFKSTFRDDFLKDL